MEGSDFFLNHLKTNGLLQDEPNISSNNNTETSTDIDVNGENKNEVSAINNEPDTSSIKNADLDFNQVKDWLKNNGLDRDFNSIEELKQQEIIVEKEVLKEVNPYESILDDDDRSYLEYKKETGRTRKEYDFLKKDINSISTIDFAVERIKRDTGLNNITREKAIEYLENKFQIDLSDESSLEVNALVELNSFIKPLKDEHLSLIEKYKKPVDKSTQEAVVKDDLPEMVALDNGSIMKKVDYENMVLNHQNHIQQAKSVADSVAGVDFSIDFDDNGVVKDLLLSYDFDQEDTQSMVSRVTNTENILQQYQTKNGFNHEQFNIDIGIWANPKTREKIVKSLINQAKAQFAEDIAKKESNVNFGKEPLPNNTPQKYGHPGLSIFNK